MILCLSSLLPEDEEEEDRDMVWYSMMIWTRVLVLGKRLSVVLRV